VIKLIIIIATICMHSKYQNTKEDSILNTILN